MELGFTSSCNIQACSIIVLVANSNLREDHWCDDTSDLSESARAYSAFTASCFQLQSRMGVLCPPYCQLAYLTIPQLPLSEMPSAE
jgi:hypothetical protein